MAVVTLDLVGRHRLVNRLDGAQLVRNARVDDLESSDPWQMLLDAITAEGMPQIGDPHPSASWLVVSQHHATPIDGCSSVEVVIQYSNAETSQRYPVQEPPDSNNDPPFREVSFTNIRRTVTEDPYFSQNYTLLPPPGLTNRNAQWAHQAEMELTFPVMTFRFHRAELDVPTNRGISIYNHVNEFLIDGRDPRTLLCTRCFSKTTSGGRWSDVEYMFAYKEDTWDEIATWRYPDGKDPGNHDEFSKLTLRTHPEADFGFLDLDFT